MIIPARDTPLICTTAAPYTSPHAMLVYNMLKTVMPRILLFDEVMQIMDIVQFPQMVIIANHGSAHAFDMPAAIVNCVQQGAMLSSILVSGKQAYIGPNVTLDDTGACPECLRIRVTQRSQGDKLRNRQPGGTNPPRLGTSLIPWIPPALIGWWTRCKPRTATGIALNVALDGSFIKQLKIMRSDACGLCAALDYVSL